MLKFTSSASGESQPATLQSQLTSLNTLPPHSPAASCRNLGWVLIKENNCPAATVKPVLSGYSKRTQKLVFRTDYRLMQVKSIAEWSILQYFRPTLSYHFSLRPLFCLFLTGFTVVVWIWDECLSKKIIVQQLVKGSGMSANQIK